MSKGISKGVVMTSAHAAIALVAACRHVDLDPTKAFQADKKAGRARRLAAAGCVSRLGVSPADAARLFHVQAIRLTPTKLSAAGISTDDLLVVAEALEQNGLTAGDDAAARFRAPQPKAQKETAAVRTPRPPVARPHVVAAVPTPAKARTPDARTSDVGARPAPIVRDSRIVATSKAWPVAQPVTRPAGRSPFRPVAGLKPISDRIVRWTLQQVRLGVSVDLMADLFEVDPELLQQKVAPAMAVAA